MNKTLILTDLPQIKLIYGFDEIFAREHIANKIKVSKKTKVSIVPEDLFGGKDVRMCDHLSFIIENKIFNKHFSKSSLKYLKKFDGETFSRFLIGRSLSKEILKIVRAIQFSNAVKNHYNISGTIFTYTENISRQIYNLSKEEIPELKNLEIKILREYEMFLYDNLRRWGGIIISLFLPIRNLFKVKNRPLTLNNKFKVGVHLYPGLGFSEDQPMDCFIDGTHCTPRNTLFIIDYMFDDIWEKQIRKKDYNILNFKTELLPSLTKIEYLFNYLLPLFSNALSVSKLMLLYPWLTGQLLKHLQATLYWSIFFDKSKIDYSMRAMIQGDLTSIAIQKKKKVKTNYIHFSTTSQIIDQKIDSTKSDCMDYTYMKFDQVMSSKISNEWLASLQNDIKYFIDKNPVGSNIAMKKRGLRKKLRKNIHIDDTRILVSCFDHTTGFGGMLNYTAYYRFWYDLFVLQEQNSNHLFCIKTKKNWDTQLNIQNENIYQILNTINRSNSWINAKDYSLSTCDWIGLSDIVISAPVSSVIFESYYAGFKIISHDPLNQYNQCHRPAEKLEGLSSHSLDQLRALYKTKIESINKTSTDVLPKTVDADFQYNLFKI